ncbi:MAG TPA: hypothetical protein VJN69_03890 [Candidatus Acidoferrales bacterium]|nr:hypothetical protein [Candidatus Acidoferrales bacterium]
MPEYEAILAPHGARFHGFIVGPKQSLILFADLSTGTTLALPELEFSSEAVVRRLAESRREFSE